MGLGATELLVILAIVLLLFGTKKLRTMGGDLGGAIRNFRSAVKEPAEGTSLADGPTAGGGTGPAR
jgi:sec-independent protein translocase protein TatA